MDEVKHSFKKEERLKGKKPINRLFKEGKSVSVGDLRLVYVLHSEEQNVPVKAGVVVPKKSHKKAVTRNLLKRRLREAYRLNNHSLKKSLIANGIYCNLMIVYQTSQLMEFDTIKDKILILLQRLENQISSKNE